MVGRFNRTSKSGRPPSGATRRTALGLILGAPLLGACSSVQQSLGQFSNPFGGSQPDAGPAGPHQQTLAVRTGQGKVGLILPLAASGNARFAGLSSNNADQKTKA